MNVRGNSVLDQEDNDNLATICCVESGWLDIDNNVSENVQRHIALGRKNRLFCGSDNGGRAAAVPNWELLLIDNGSTDGSLGLLRSWAEKDSRIRLFQTAENSGQCPARNLALSHARAEYVYYLDQDDEFYAHP